MNKKENLLDFFDPDDDSKEKKDDKKDMKMPFDMKTFWKKIDEKYFKTLNEFNLTEPNHLIQLFSKYGTYFFYLLNN
jgi:hypothetical protein